MSFLAEKNLSAEEVKKAEFFSLWNSNKKKYTDLARFARRYLLTPQSSVYSLEAGNLYEKKTMIVFSKASKNL